MVPGVNIRGKAMVASVNRAVDSGGALRLSEGVLGDRVP